ncbi:hypothetical protein AB9C95_15335 [Serratia marcescens]|uniref:hypothetical protein n=1 Tax=Serratia marcescens TaxID=615 RepID=UPI0035105C65
MAITLKTSKYYTFNTSVFLMETYEELALKVDNLHTNYRTEYDDSGNIISKKMINSCENIKTNVTMINLNAAIIEGTIRQIFSSILHEDHQNLGEMARVESDPNIQKLLMRAYKQISSTHINIESQGGWDNLKEAINNYLDIKIEDFINNKSAFRTLFQLRNAIAHGTALIEPKDRMEESDKGTYLFKWQSRLQESSTFINNTFNCQIFDAFRRPDFSKIFWDETVTFMGNIRQSNKFACKQDFLLKNFSLFSYGYRSNHLWQREEVK